MNNKDQVEYTGNGTAGREADVRPTGFFFQIPKHKEITMPTDKELMQQALDALESECDATKFGAAEAIRARLEQPEPVAWMYEYGTDHGDAVNEVRWYKNVNWKMPTGLVRNVVPLYAAPPQREFIGLTDEEQLEIMKQFGPGQRGLFADAIEAKLKEKNA